VSYQGASGVYKRATYLDARGSPHSISAVCIHAHFLSSDRAQRGTKDGASGLPGLKQFLDVAVAEASAHGTTFVDPSVEVMEAEPNAAVGEV
jgi:hypothetical protein